MSERNDGGPAFGGAFDLVLIDQVAGNPAQKIERRVPGMSLWDYFAAAALPECLAEWRKRPGEVQSEVSYATLAYDAADAMLAERSK